MTRIAVGGLLHETNTFTPTGASYADFVHGGGWPAQAILVRADFEPIAATRLIWIAPGAMPADSAALTRLRPGLRLKPNGPALVAPVKSRSPSPAIG